VPLLASSVPTAPASHRVRCMPPGLQDIAPFEEPKVELEQYPTGPHIAARMLYTVRPVPLAFNCSAMPNRPQLQRYAAGQLGCRWPTALTSLTDRL
jgi:hypothetical protein